MLKKAISQIHLESCFWTQSALSHQLIGLEKRLGFKVFHRMRNRWELTEEGRELHVLANEVLASIEKGLAKIQGMKEGVNGTIRISTECSTFYQGFPSFMQKMGYLYPEINIELKGVSLQPFTQLLSQEIDAAIVTSEPNAEGLLAIQFFRDSVVAVMHEEHHLANRAFLNASDFLKEHLIIQSYPLSTVSVIQHFLKPHHIHPIKISEGIHTEICLEMVAANMGITCLPRWVLKPFNIPDHLIFKPIGVNGLHRNHYLVIRTEDRGKKYIEDFVRNFEEEFSTRNR